MFRFLGDFFVFGFYREKEEKRKENKGGGEGRRIRVYLQGRGVHAVHMTDQVVPPTSIPEYETRTGIIFFLESSLWDWKSGSRL